MLNLISFPFSCSKLGLYSLLCGFLLYLNKKAAWRYFDEFYSKTKRTCYYFLAKLNTSKEAVSYASENAQQILDALEALVQSFNRKEDEVRRKMAEWPGLIRRLEDLLTNVTSANSTAHDAIARGEDTLKKAKDMLDRLRVTIVFFAL